MVVAVTSRKVWFPQEQIFPMAQVNEFVPLADNRTPKAPETPLCSATHTVGGAALAQMSRSVIWSENVIYICIGSCVCEHTCFYTRNMPLFFFFFLFASFFFSSSITEKEPKGGVGFFVLFLALKNEKS